MTSAFLLVLLLKKIKGRKLAPSFEYMADQM